MRPMERRTVVRLAWLVLGLLAVLLVTACAANEPEVAADDATAVENSTAVEAAAGDGDEGEVAASDVATEGAAKPAAGVFSRYALIADARQLLRIIEENHPDPYTHGGGKLAFHLRFQRLLAAIPEEGMTKEEFSRLLIPFVATVGDGHTDVWAEYDHSLTMPGGVPLRFQIVEQSLYVAAVPSLESLDLLGGTLVAVEGVSVDELRTRMHQLRGIENEYADLLWLIDALWYRDYLVDLLPDWPDDGTIAVELCLPDGRNVERSLSTPVYSGRLRWPETAIETIGPGPHLFDWAFLDSMGKTAMLRVDGMVDYREVLGRTGGLTEADITDEKRAATPSATETFRDLVVEMKDAGTETLLIDLRNNPGGHSLMAEILVFFLYGKRALFDIAADRILRGGGQIERIGPLEMKYYSADELADLSEMMGFPVQMGDYKTVDHYEYYAAYAAKLGVTFEELAEATWQDYREGRYGEYSEFPEFHAEFSSGTYAGYYAPANVIVLVRPRTYSSGFTMMQVLDIAGATLIGTPSAQSANTFGEGMIWSLDNTGIGGLVSHNWYISCADDPERGRVWPVDVTLTHEYLAATNFDPNAEVLLAFEWIETQEAERLTRLEEKVEFLRQELGIPGLSAAIVRNEELIWAEGFGFASVEDAIPSTPQTPYGLASVTKPFAAVLLMRLVEGDLLDLDAPAIDFGIDLGNPEITIRHLLSHTSCDVPGTEFSYDGNRYSMLTAVIERLYGDSFRNILREEILSPLGMDTTALNVGGCGIHHFLSALQIDDPERAFEHVYRDAAIPYQYGSDYDVYPVDVPTYANAAAGLISTVEDLARFAVALDRNELMLPETKTLMTTPTRLNSGEEGPYALGWFVEEVYGTQLIWHYGYGAYSSLFLTVPSEELTFIVLANSQNLSRPFGLGFGDVSVLASPFALAFYKEFCLEPSQQEDLPDVDWTAETPQIVGQLAAIEDPELRDLYEGELWTYRKLYGGMGDSRVVNRLTFAHLEAFPDVNPSDHDMMIAGRPGPRPEARESIELASDEIARWTGRYALRPEDAVAGLPAEMEIVVEGTRILAIPTNGECQEFIATTPLRLNSRDLTDMFLVIEPGDGPAATCTVEYQGAMAGAYDRVE